MDGSKSDHVRSWAIYPSQPSDRIVSARPAVTRDVIRIGIIGTGMMGCEHIRNIASLDGAVVSAFSDPHEMSHTWARDNLAHAGSNQDAAHVLGFHDHRELLDSGLVDAVIIASPNHTHVDVLRDVLATDLPCLVEKPMCTTIEDCHEVIGAASTRSALTWVGLEYRYMPPIATLVQHVRRDDVGEVKMNLVIGAHPRFVYASGGQDVNHLDERYPDGTPDILDNAFVIVDYENGVRASLDLCMFAEASRNEQEISVVGSRGKIETALPGDGHVHIGSRANRALTSVAAPIDPMVAHVGFHFGSSFVEVARFCEAIRNGTAPEVTVEDGLWSVVIGVAAHRSIDEGRRVAIEELVNVV